MRTPDFNIKWKLFKLYLKENGMKHHIYLPTNKKEIDATITLIKKLNC